FFSFFYGFSQNATSIEEIYNYLNLNKVTSGDFILEKKSEKLKRPLKSFGKFVFSQEGILWKTEKPFPSVMAITTTYIIQTKIDGSKVVTDGSSNEVFKSVAQTISSLFSGNINSLENFFLINDFSYQNNEWKVSLKPKDKNIESTLNNVVIGGVFKEKKASMDFIQIMQNKTDVTTYNLLNQIYKQELNDEELAFFKK
ncbi:MAG: outer membrane lipoprotein carrier protein LolA, partial [Treponema sp.]|nr:outer membrane lipoprotein carrier protein LolA [Treponema sp.]